MNYGLGTVQFGMEYGIANKIGRPSGPDVDRILSMAYDSGFRMLDTAPGYGDSEEILGKYIKRFPRFRVVTKTCRIEGNVPGNNLLSLFKKSLQDSLRKLRVGSVDVLLLHQPELLMSHGVEIVEVLLDLKRSGLTRSIGVSIYTAEDIDRALALFKPDMIQLPINLFDQRLLQSSHLARLRMQSVEVVARSVFLQGLLLMDESSRPSSMKRWNKEFQRYDDYVSSHALKRLEACVGFISRVDLVDAAIVGVCSPGELQEILDAINAAKTMKINCAELAVKDEDLLNPSRWGRA